MIADIEQYNIDVRLIENKLQANLVESKLEASLTEVIVIEKETGGGGGEAEVVNVISFTDTDLVNGQLIKLHGLNRRVVSVTVTDPQGVEFDPPISNLNDNTRVLIDLSRYNIQGTWYLTIR